MEALEIFLSQWRNTVLFMFSVIGVLLTVVRIYGFCQSRINKVIEEAVTTALIDQRQNYQAEAIDELLRVIGKQHEGLERYSKAKEDDAINSAIVKQLLQSNNITAKC